MKRRADRNHYDAQAYGGGKGVVPFVDVAAQHSAIRAEIDSAVRAVLDSAQFVGGPWVEQFEAAFAHYVGAEFAVGVSSGTAALQLALKAAGIGNGDDVIVPANSFFATAEAVSNVGARPVFADVDPDTFHIDTRSAARVLTAKTRAIIPVHLYGRALNMVPLMEQAAHKRLMIIEDAAQAHGSMYAGQRVGSSGRLTAFSFYPGKNLGACGDAGAITTSDPDLAQRIRILRDHGSPKKYAHCMVGDNARLDSLQAAILQVKLPYLDKWNCLRRSHAAAYTNMLRTSEIITPAVADASQHNFHLYVVRVPSRDELLVHLQARGVCCGVHYPTPIHLTAAYQALGAPAAGSLPVAESLATEILSLPMFPELTMAQITRTVSAISEFCSRKTARRSAA